MSAVDSGARDEAEGQETQAGAEDVRADGDEGQRGPEVNAKEQEESKEEEQSDTRKPKPGRIPGTPTKAELAEHLPLHVPYREWCPVCVAGEGIQNQSRMATAEEKEGCGITISMDYCFMTSDDGVEGDPTVLVVHDDKC